MNKKKRTRENTTVAHLFWTAYFPDDFTVHVFRPIDVFVVKFTEILRPLMTYIRVYNKGSNVLVISHVEFSSSLTIMLI